MLILKIRSNLILIVFQFQIHRLDVFQKSQIFVMQKVPSKTTESD